MQEMGQRSAAFRDDLIRLSDYRLCVPPLTMACFALAWWDSLRQPSPLFACFRPTLHIIGHSSIHAGKAARRIHRDSRRCCLLLQSKRPTSAAQCVQGPLVRPPTLTTYLTVVPSGTFGRGLC